MMKIVNIEEENLHIIWTNWGISMKFSGKMWLTIILKVQKTGLPLLSKKIHFWKNHSGIKLPPPRHPPSNKHKHFKFFDTVWEANLRIKKTQDQPPEVFYKNGALKTLEHFTGKYIARVSFFIKLQNWGLYFFKNEIFKDSFLQNTSGQLLLKTLLSF